MYFDQWKNIVWMKILNHVVKIIKKKQLKKLNTKRLQPKHSWLPCHTTNLVMLKFSQTQIISNKNLNKLNKGNPSKPCTSQQIKFVSKQTILVLKSR